MYALEKIKNFGFIINSLEGFEKLLEYDPNDATDAEIDCEASLYDPLGELEFKKGFYQFRKLQFLRSSEE